MDPLRATALVIAIASMLAAVLCLGGAVSDRLDVLTHFAPFYLAGGMVALLICLACGAPLDRPTLGCSLIAILACAMIVAPDVLARNETWPLPPGEAHLKLIQFNLWEHNVDPAGTARWIEDEDPDIVVLEEAENGGERVAAALRERYPFSTTCDAPRPCSTMIFSKVRPAASGGLQSPGMASRLAGAWAVFGQGAARFTVVGAHYGWPIPAGVQKAQGQRLARVLDRFERPSLIVAGDFNSTPWSFALRRQDARFGLQRRTHALPSWPARPTHFWPLPWPFPFLPIDHVYAGADWRTVSVRRGPRLGSDHFPVVVVLARRPAG
jgi:endonuclease/exonuclease/phosphatase (EEP) superfamily protein YafD